MKPPHPTVIKYQLDRRSSSAEVLIASEELVVMGLPGEDEVLPPPTATTAPGGNPTSCAALTVVSLLAAALVVAAVIAARDYVRVALLALEETSPGISIAVFLGLFTVVSFPLTWGYIVLNIAAGYLYGSVAGVAVVIVCAMAGVSVAHFCTKLCLRNLVLTRLMNDSVRGLMRVVDSPQGFKVVVLSRLTPIPFGLQNAVFAVSALPYPRYIAASALGMLPSQGMHAYIGSTLRSMEEVVNGGGGGAGDVTAYVVFSIQILMVVVLLAYIVRRAKFELNQTVDDLELSKRRELLKNNNSLNLKKSTSEEVILTLEADDDDCVTMQYLPPRGTEVVRSPLSRTHARSASSCSYKEYYKFIHNNNKGSSKSTISKSTVAKKVKEQL